jgi:hypothetical protein
MAPTKSHGQPTQRHALPEPRFANALFRDGVETLLSGDVENGKAILRDYGFEKLGEAVGTQAKGLIHMFGPSGNPQAKNPFCVIGYLQKRGGRRLYVTMS